MLRELLNEPEGANFWVIPPKPEKGRGKGNHCSHILFLLLHAIQLNARVPCKITEANHHKLHYGENRAEFTQQHQRGQWHTTQCLTKGWINGHLKLRNTEPETRGETKQREEGQGKRRKKRVHYLKSLTPEIPEGAKKQQRDSSAAASDTDRSNAAITSPYTFENWCAALEIWQVESCNLARIVI